jgi:hypothetical protein
MRNLAQIVMYHFEYGTQQLVAIWEILLYKQQTNKQLDRIGS